MIWGVCVCVEARGTGAEEIKKNKLTIVSWSSASNSFERKHEQSARRPPCGRIWKVMSLHTWIRTLPTWSFNSMLETLCQNRQTSARA